MSSLTLNSVFFVMTSSTFNGPCTIPDKVFLLASSNCDPQICSWITLLLDNLTVSTVLEFTEGNLAGTCQCTQIASQIFTLTPSSGTATAALVTLVRCLSSVLLLRRWQGAACARWPGRCGCAKKTSVITTLAYCGAATLPLKHAVPAITSSSST